MVSSLLIRWPILILSIVLGFGSVQAKNINIGILERYKIQRFQFTPKEGSYTIYADNRKVAVIDTEDLLYVIHRNGKVEIKTPQQSFGHFTRVNIIGTETRNYFRVTPLVPEKKIRHYDDNLKISVARGALRLVNNIYLENYIAGVVEAEVGPNPAPEFFKLQAILCRTYALINQGKHEYEGFNLCDRVHCQAYHRRTKDEEIRTASYTTKGQVIVDSDIELITASFYSNCGGQTVNSEDVWQRPLYYLRSVKDPHCLGEPNARWHRKIPKSDWIKYLNSKVSYGQRPNTDSVNLKPFYQKERRTALDHYHVSIPLKSIRSDWRLKSTYFDVIPNGDYVHLNGRGFGHGTGLCQEGAMRMASKGFSYPEILHFYYRDVHLVDLSAIDFFKED